MQAGDTLILAFALNDANHAAKGCPEIDLLRFGVDTIIHCQTSGILFAPRKDEVNRSPCHRQLGDLLQHDLLPRFALSIASGQALRVKTPSHGAFQAIARDAHDGKVVSFCVKGAARAVLGGPRSGGSSVSVRRQCSERATLTNRC
jgi:hypothetical protein